MKKESFYASTLKLGAISVVITGICYFIIAICALFAPGPVASYVASAYYFEDFQSYQHYFILLKYLMFIANASMLGFILSIYYLKNRSESASFILLTVLAMMGLAIGMLQSILDATRIPHLASEYEHTSSVIQHVIIAFGVSNPAIYMLSLGFPGIWLIFVNLTMRKEFPPLLVLSGILWGIGCVVTVIAHVFVLMPIIYLIALGALIGVPVWTYFQTKYLWDSYKKSLDHHH